MSRPCILLVEDEPLIALDLETFLDEEGFEVAGPFSSVADILQQLPSLVIAVAVLDVNLRGEQVFSLAERLSEDGTPFVFVSGTTKDIIPECFRNRPFFSKPVQRRKLLAALRNIAAPPPVS